MSPSLADARIAFYQTALSKTGSLQTLEREYFLTQMGGVVTDPTSWNDAARNFFGSMNGSSPVGSLNDERFKYYSTQSGLTPVASYSLLDHMFQVFATNGGPYLVPPILTGLEAYYSSYIPTGVGGAVLADGAIVTQWNDLSGKGKHLNQGTANRRPLYRKVNPNLLSYNQATLAKDTTGWVSGYNAPTIARSTAVQQYGPACLSLTSTTLADGGAFGAQQSAGLPVTPGQTYTALLSGRAAVTPRNFQVVINWLDSGSVYISQSVSAGYTDAVGSWTNGFVTGVAPPGAAFAHAIPLYLGSVIGEVHYVSNISLAIGTSTAWLPPANSRVAAGRPGIQFDGTLSVLPGTGFPVMGNSTVYVAGEHLSHDGATSLRTLAINGGAGSHDQMASNTGKIGSKLGSGFPANLIDAVGAPHIITTTYDGANGNLRCDGINPASAAGAGALGTNLAIGAGSNAGGNLSFSIVHAVLVYSTVHSAGNKTTIERWLGAQFGIVVA